MEAEAEREWNRRGQQFFAWQCCSRGGEESNWLQPVEKTRMTSPTMIPPVQGKLNISSLCALFTQHQIQLKALTAPYRELQTMYIPLKTQISAHNLPKSWSLQTRRTTQKKWNCQRQLVSKTGRDLLFSNVGDANSECHSRLLLF